MRLRDCASYRVCSAIQSLVRTKCLRKVRWRTCWTKTCLCLRTPRSLFARCSTTRNWATRSTPCASAANSSRTTGLPGSINHGLLLPTAGYGWHPGPTVRPKKPANLCSEDKKLAKWSESAKCYAFFIPRYNFKWISAKSSQFEAIWWKNQFFWVREMFWWPLGHFFLIYRFEQSSVSPNVGLCFVRALYRAHKKSYMCEEKLPSAQVCKQTIKKISDICPYDMVVPIGKPTCSTTRLAIW